MVIRAIAAAGLAGAMVLSASAPQVALAEPSGPSAARCSAAYLIKLTTDPDLADSGDAIEASETWQALTTLERDGLATYMREAEAFSADPTLAAGAYRECAAIDPFARLPKLPKPPKGDTFACLSPMKESAAAMKRSARDQMSLAEVCSGIDEAQKILLAGRQALERGELSCLEDDYSLKSAWTGASQTLFTLAVLRAGLGDRCDQAVDDRVASL